jgi:hypothetical protein
VLGAGVVFEEERDVGSVLRPDAEPVGAWAEFAAAGVQVVGGFAFAVPPQEFTAAVLAGVPRQGDEEPRRAGHVSQALGAFEGKLPVRADHRQPSFLVAVFLAEQRGADGAEDVVPRRGAGLKVRPEAAQQAQAHDHRQAVPGGGDVPERERGELVGGQYAVPRHQAHKLTVAVGQVTGHGQHRCLVPGRPGADTCACACPARMRM